MLYYFTKSEKFQKTVTSLNVLTLRARCLKESARAVHCFVFNDMATLLIGVNVFTITRVL